MNASNSPALPAGLTTYIPDSELSVVTWNAIEGILVLELKKDIGNEQGKIAFTGVSRVCLPAWLEVSDFDFTRESRFLTDPLEADEFLFIVCGVSWESPFYVVAKTISYEVTP